MAIKTETIEINGTSFVHTYSDEGYTISRDEIEYAEAYDPIEYSADRIYIETENLIEQPEEEIEATLDDIKTGDE